MKNKFFSVSIGISMMLLSAGFFIRSFNIANATPAPEKFFEQGTNKIGKYMMAFQLINANGWYKEILVWDTETGKSKFYLDMNPNTDLPAKPLE